MTRNCHASRVLTIMALLTFLSFLHLSSPNLVSTIGDYDNPPREVLPRLPVSENMERMQKQAQLASKDQTEKEEELFKDVDPKRLAALLLEALNHTHVERDKDGVKYNSMKEEIQAERDKIKKEEPYSKEVARDRERYRQKELELFIASHGKESEREEEEEKKKAHEEEERMTEKVTSHTTSQMVQIQTKQQPSSSDGITESGAAGQQVSPDTEQSSYEEEEQLNPEELKSLETMMKEFPRLNTKRDGVLEQRNTRGYSSYNDIIPIHNKGSDLAITKKKLKWQEETQKAIYFQTFTGGNSIEESEYGNYIKKKTQAPSPAKQEEVQDDDTKEEDDEEMLSPEEEEARAKVEQEEMMRQAAEAQKAKMEEEKLADIASDMLLSYMGKQNKGDKKHSLSLSNVAEDKRSDEEQEVTEENDLDPQTIDKLIEISSKLHLPADDVVDIITDVEKKKKKDVPSEMASVRQYTSSLLSPSFHSAWQVPSNQNNLPVSKQPSPAVNILKTWFQEKNTPKSDVSQMILPKPLLPYNLSPKPEKSFSVKQDHWFKLPKSVWTGYSMYPYSYSSYHQRKPILGYYPFYFPPIPRPKPHYYMPKPALTLKNVIGNSVEDLNIFPPKRRYQSWVQTQLRKSPASLKHKSFYSSYYPRRYSQPFQRIPTSQANFPSQKASQQKQFLISALEPPVTKNKDYHEGGKQPDSSIHDDVENYIQQILMNRAQRMDLNGNNINIRELV